VAPGEARQQRRPDAGVEEESSHDTDEEQIEALSGQEHENDQQCVCGVSAG